MAEDAATASLIGTARQLARAEHDALGRVDVHRRDEQRAAQLGEGVAAAARGQPEPDEALERGQREESGRQVALGARQHVGQAGRPSLMACLPSAHMSRPKREATREGVAR